MHKKIILILIFLINTIFISCHSMKYNAKDFFDSVNLEFALAIQKEDLEKMKHLQDKITINHVGNEEMTFIMWAIVNQTKQGLEQVLKMGADPNKKDKDGETPVAFVCAAKDIDYLSILLKYKGNPNCYVSNGEPAIIFAALHGSWRNITRLLEYGADVEMTDKDGDTVIMTCAAISKYKEVYQLIKYGANVFHENKYGKNLIDRLKNANPDKGTEVYDDLEDVKILLRTKNVFI